MEETDEFGQWNSYPTDSQHNIYANLSYNLQKYESQHKRNLSKFPSFRINRMPVKHNTITVAKTQFQQHYQIQRKQSHIQGKQRQNRLQNKENQNSQGCWLDTEIISKTGKYTKGSKLTAQARIVRSSCGSNQNARPIESRQLRFEHKDKKRAKEKWVNLFAELKGGKMMSLKQMDTINKQNKEEKIDLFRKLLKR